MAVTAQADDILRVISAAFDADFYRAAYADLPAHMDALEHYRTEGWREWRDPAPWFSTHAYLAANPDVVAAGTEPLHHYLTAGRREGREVWPSPHAVPYLEAIDWAPDMWTGESLMPAQARRAADPAEASPARARAAVAARFDRAFYLAQNPDIAADGMDPLDHYQLTGWREGRDPSPRFSTHGYLEANPDVAAAGLNPLTHYVLRGRAEGRHDRHALGFRYDVIARSRPLSERISRAVAASAALTPEPAEALAAGLAGLGDVHLTFSHDDYVRHAGGLQLCLRRESGRFAAQGVEHLHFYPAALWPAVREAAEPGPLGVLRNGEPLGVFAPGTVAEVLARTPLGARRSFAIHSLLGHAPDAAADILSAAGLRRGYFWLHDFASLCAGVHLLRNDVADCGAPPAESAACGVCAYGPFRARHVAAHRRLFERLDLIVVAPSDSALAFWRARGGQADADAVVLPHARLVARGRAATDPSGRPFRIAFLGMPAPHKGWPVFRELAERLAGDGRYEFLHLGGASDRSSPATFHPVMVTAAHPTAMQDAVAALGIDAALVWPLCRETFSFITYEAAAGGAAVITGPDSGNVAAFVGESGAGRVMADEAALAQAFETGAVLELGRRARGATSFDLVFSGLTADLVFGAAP